MCSATASVYVWNCGGSMTPGLYHWMRNWIFLTVGMVISIYKLG